MTVHSIDIIALISMYMYENKSMPPSQNTETRKDPLTWISIKESSFVTHSYKELTIEALYVLD